MSGQNARDYLRHSILNPLAFVVDGFDDGKMPTDLGDVLSPDEVEVLVG